MRAIGKSRRRASLRDGGVFFEKLQDIPCIASGAPSQAAKSAAREEPQDSKGAKIHTLSLSNILHQNRVGQPLPLLINEGEIDRLYMYNMDAGEDETLVNRGVIGKITEI